jgi:hypothetical protein
VFDHFSGIVEAKVQPVLSRLSMFESELTRLRQDIEVVNDKVNKLGHDTDGEVTCINLDLQATNECVRTLEKEVRSMNAKIAVIEAYSRQDNLIITGLPAVDYADAGSSAAVGSGVETSKSTEKAVLELVNNRLGLQLTVADISTTHRLKTKNASPAPVMVRFTNRRARESVYAARL